MRKTFECVAVRKFGDLSVVVSLESRRTATERIDLLAPLRAAAGETRFIIGQTYVVSVDPEHPPGGDAPSDAAPSDADEEGKAE